MRCKLAWVLLVVLVVFSGCNVEEKEQDLTKVELRPDDVVMGAMCRYKGVEIIERAAMSQQ